MAEESQRRTVIVTGGNGRVGRLLVEDLRDRGLRVVSVARDLPAEPHVDDVAADLENPTSVKEVVSLADADVIVHLAAVLRGDSLEAANERIDRAVSDAARFAGIAHVVYASSAAVYGTDQESARCEDSPLAGTSPYARSKILGETIFQELADGKPSISVIILRIFNLAGPAFAASLVERLKGATPERPVTLSAPDRFVRDYVNQNDLLDVLRAAVAAAEPGSRTINVGTGVAMSTRTLIETLKVPRDRYVELDGGEPSVSWADTTELVRVLGIRPHPISE